MLLLRIGNHGREMESADVEVWTKIFGYGLECRGGYNGALGQRSSGED